MNALPTLSTTYEVDPLALFKAARHVQMLLQGEVCHGRVVTMEERQSALEQLNAAIGPFKTVS